MFLYINRFYFEAVLNHIEEIDDEFFDQIPNTVIVILINNAIRELVS